MLLFWLCHLSTDNVVAKVLSFCLGDYTCENVIILVGVVVAIGMLLGRATKAIVSWSPCMVTQCYGGRIVYLFCCSPFPSSPSPPEGGNGKVNRRGKASGKGGAATRGVFVRI